MKSNIKSYFLIFLTLTATGLILPDSTFGITVKEEEEISRQLMKMVNMRFEIIDDPLIAGYINRIGKKIVSVLPEQQHKYRFFVIKQHVYNAFATPGGDIYLHSGLIEAMESEEELAGIIGHEISHVYCRHISKQIENAPKIGLATLVGLAAGIFLGKEGSGDLAKAITIGSMAAGKTIALAYSREHEMQADQIGLKYLNKAGYGGKGLLTILKKLRSKQWYGSEQVPTYLMTHPAVEERIAYIDTQLQNPKNSTGLQPVNPDDFYKAHTRLVAKYGEEESAISKLKEIIFKFPDDPTARHGYGLVLARTGKRDKAIEQLKKALELNAFDAYILADLGNIYFLAGRYAEALKTLEGAATIDPDNPEGLFNIGRTKLELQQYDGAVQAFEKLRDIYPTYRNLLYFLGESYGKQGKLGEAHYCFGRYYFKKRALKASLFHLKKALKTTKDPDRKKEITSIINKINKTLKKTSVQNPEGQKRMDWR